MVRYSFLVIKIALLLFLAAGTQAEEPRFAQVLTKHCVKCHHAGEKSGGLAVDSLASLEAGGDSGAAIEKGAPEASLIIQYVSGEKPEMPKDSPPLSKEEIEVLTEWVKSGAAWPGDVKVEAPKTPSADWWSLKPITNPPVPFPSALAALRGNSVDAFLLARLEAEGLTYSPQASRRVLIRRLYYDLLGLPPTPEEIVEFENDAHPLAYERLVDKLLASPRYGERWARHWLDLVHYGETHGYDKDKPRLNSWPYRDYVIRSFNSDKPFKQFTEEQLAGDVLYPGTKDGIEALGFLAAGPWDFIGHEEVPEDKIDGKVARHLDRDDIISTTIQAFSSLTIQCAQCHYHKFDPISQEDYYSLQAVFAAIDRPDRNYDADPLVAARRRELASQIAALEKQEREIRETVKARIGPEWQDWVSRRQKLREKIRQQRNPAEHGYHSELADSPGIEKWVQVNLPATVKAKEIILRPCHDDFAGIGSGFGFPKRFKVEVAKNEGMKESFVALDNTAEDYPNPGLAEVSIALPAQEVQSIRITATRLAQRLENDFMLALAELEVIDETGKNVALGAKVVSLDSIEAGSLWGRDNLTDGKYPGESEASREASKLGKQIDEVWKSTITAEEKASLESIASKIGDARTAIDRLPPQATAYIGAVHTGGGNFIGTGHDGGKPRKIHVLKRGNVSTPAEEVGPGAIKAIAGLNARFDDIKDAPEGERRAALARWLTDAKHPLVWRSIVNRIWQHHFGQGIVASPNDFGHKGELPSHPELLDYLATQFRDGGQSLKGLHRQILLSAAYRQSSQPTAENAAIGKEKDPGNRLLWKMARRRIEAEALRDSAVILSGEMRWTMYGPSFQDFVIDKPEHSPHYEYDKHDPTDPAAYRRSIYRFIVRSQPQPLMAALDCADPSLQVDKRNESVSATQALSLLNDPFMTLMAEKFAARLSQERETLESQIARGFEETTGRAATREEQAILVDLAKKHGLPNACRLLLNLNEFVFVD